MDIWLVWWRGNQDHWRLETSEIAEKVKGMNLEKTHPRKTNMTKITFFLNRRYIILRDLEIPLLTQPMAEL